MGAKKNIKSDLLNVHLDYGLADEGGAEESPKGNQKVAASYTGLQTSSQKQDWYYLIKNKCSEKH